MKATLNYDLPGEEIDFRDATNGWRWRCVVETLDSELRDRLKYGDLPDPLHDELQTVRERLNALVAEYTLTMYEE